MHDARNPVKADPHFHIHVRDLDKKHYWKKYDESKAKYGEEPWPVHLKEMPELIIRFPGKGHPRQCISMAEFTFGVLIGQPG